MNLVKLKIFPAPHLFMGIVLLLVPSIPPFSQVSCYNPGRDPQPVKEMYAAYREVRRGEAESLRSFLDRVIDHYDLPAITAALVTKDSISEIAWAGVRNTVTQKPVGEYDLYSIGSCTKSMTAVVAAVLVERGVCSWDTRVRDVFPPSKGEEYTPLGDARLVELLSHQAGIEPYYSDRFFNVYHEKPFLTGNLADQRRKFTRFQARQEPFTQPGEFSYSNGGYVVAAAMLEELSGRSWEQLIREELFIPLGLQSAFVGMPYEAGTNQPARHYRRDDDGHPVPLPEDDRIIPALFSPAGSVSLTVRDFAIYAMFHLRGLAGGNGILSSESVRNLHEPLLESDDEQYYALGWGVRWYGHDKVSGHSGGDQTVAAMIALDHTSLTGAVVMCNMGDERASTACANVVLEIMP